MSIIDKPGLPLIYSLVKEENPSIPVTLSENSVRLSDQATVAGEQVTAVISGKYGSGLSGRKEITFTTVDLFKLFNGQRLSIGVRAVRPIHEQLIDIYQQTGIQLGVGDVDNLVPSAQELPYVTTLRASATSAAYTGEIEVEFKERLPRLDEVITRSDHDVLIAPYAPDADGSTRCEYLTYGVDYTYAVEALKTHTVGVLSSQSAIALANALTSVDDYPWTLANATVVYNGPVLTYVPEDGYRYAHQRYTHVLVVDVPEQPTLAGSLFIHYNVME